MPGQGGSRAETSTEVKAQQGGTADTHGCDMLLQEPLWELLVRIYFSRNHYFPNFIHLLSYCVKFRKGESVCSIFHWLFYSPQAPSSHGWTRPEPAPRAPQPRVLERHMLSLQMCIIRKPTEAEEPGFKRGPTIAILVWEY